MSTSGFKSQYNDSGYNTPSTGAYYGSTGTLLSAGSLIASSDVYTNSQQVGVYMMNGNKGFLDAALYPAVCSSTNLNAMGIPNIVDDAWLVYPGYGIKVYTDINNGGTSSRNYTNNTSNPVVFATGATFISAGATQILTESGTAYANNSTKSIKIYFRFQEITINGIS